MTLAAIVHPGACTWVADDALPAGDISFALYRDVAETS